MKYMVYAEFPSGSTFEDDDCIKRDGKPIVSIEDGVIVLRLINKTGYRMKMVGASSCMVTEVKD